MECCTTKCTPQRGCIPLTMAHGIQPLLGSGGSKGGTGDPRPHLGPIFFLNFMQFLINFNKIVSWCPPWGLAPPPRRNPGSATAWGAFCCTPCQKPVWWYSICNICIPLLYISSRRFHEIWKPQCARNYILSSRLTFFYNLAHRIVRYELLPPLFRKPSVTKTIDRRKVIHLPKEEMKYQTTQDISG